MAQKKLCHVVEHIFLSTFVIHRKIPSLLFRVEKLSWSFFFKRLFCRLFLWLWGPQGPHIHHRRWWISCLKWRYNHLLSFGAIALFMGPLLLEIGPWEWLRTNKSRKIFSSYKVRKWRILKVMWVGTKNWFTL